MSISKTALNSFDVQDNTMDSLRLYFYLKCKLCTFILMFNDNFLVYKIDLQFTTAFTNFESDLIQGKTRTHTNQNTPKITI